MVHLDVEDFSEELLQCWLFAGQKSFVDIDIEIEIEIEIDIHIHIYIYIIYY